MLESVLDPAKTEPLLCPAAQAFEIGSDWLCFSTVSKRENSHNPLLKQTLRSFGLLEIGFVFSKPYSNSASISPLITARRAKKPCFSAFLLILHSQLSIS
jgi:hypothetical protein